MNQQNFKNHSRFVPLYHYVALTLVLAILVGASINLCYNAKHNTYSSWLIFALSIIVALLWFFCRAFALQAQDRVIRAEENFRYYILTGKQLSSQLHIKQIVALRFASDEELVALAQKAVAEQLSSKLIKQAIVNWRGDYYRV